MKETRRLVYKYRNNLHDSADVDIQIFKEPVDNRESRIRRSFDKSIIALKIASNKFSEIINGIDENWIIFETLMQQKNSLDAQIDTLLREKRKFRNISKYIGNNF